MRLRYPLKKLWKIHSIFSVWASTYMIFLFATGVLAIFSDQALRIENWQASRVEPTPWDWSSMADYLDAANTYAHSQSPGFRLTELIVPQKPDHAALFFYLNPKKRPISFQKTPANFAKGVFLDPNSAEVTGSFDATRSIDGYIRALHIRFFAGVWGRNLTGIFGIILLIASLSGLAIVFKFTRKGQLFQWNPKNPRKFAADIHKSLGLITLPFLFIFAITGAWLGLQGRLMSAFDIERPEKFEREPSLSAAEDEATPIDWAGAIKAAEKNFPDLKIKAVQISANGSNTITFKGNIPGALIERNVSRIVIDKQTLEPIFKMDPRAESSGTQLFFIQEALHFGDFGGWWSIITWTVAGLLITIIPLAGLIIYLRRNGYGYIYLKISLITALSFSIACLILHKWLGLQTGLQYGLILLGLILPFTIMGLFLIKGNRRKPRGKHSPITTAI